MAVRGLEGRPRHMGEGRRGRPGGHRRAALALALVICCAAAAALALGLLGAAGGGSSGPSDAAASRQDNPSGEGSSVGDASPAEASGGAAGDATTQADVGQDGEAAESAGQEAGTSEEAGQVREASSDEVPAGRADAVREAVQPVVSPYGGTVSVAYVSLSDESDACYLEADRKVRSASLIKLVILAEYLREVEAGTLSGSEAYTLRASDIVGGTGSLQGRGAGFGTTLDALAGLMISESDNVAANVLIDRMGMSAINAEAASLGLSSTSLGRKMMDSAAIAAGQDNYTSARDVARVLALIGEGRLVSQEASAKALAWLERQTDRSGIPAGLPAGTACGNKTGSLDSSRHDGAIVLGERPYVLVVMTDGLGAAADPLIAQVSSAVWQAVGQ